MTEIPTAALARSLQGDVLIRSDATYAGACRGFNLSDAHEPDAVVLANTEADICAAVG